MKCPNPQCDYIPEPTDWCCEVCGTRLHPDSNPAPAIGASAPACVCTVFDAEGYCESCGKKQEIRPDPVFVEVSRGLASVSDIGMKHHVNQDAALVSKLPNGDYLLAISDGVSTAENSEIASAKAVQKVLDVLSQGPLDDPGASLVNAVKAADDAIRAMPYEQMSSLAEPQATMVAAIVRGSKAWISWVGDSRAYELGALNRQLTVDDSWYEMAVAQGMPKDQAQADRRAHAITQCLGMRDETPDVHLKETTLEPGSSLLLCTDGLWNYYEEADVLAGLVKAGVSNEPAISIARRLVDKANQAGGRDNISVALLTAGA